LKFKRTWNNFGLKTNTLKVIDTKNHLDHTLPLSDFLYELLQQRKNNAINEYVFQRALKLVMSSEALAAYAKYAGAILVLENQVVCE